MHPPDPPPRPPGWDRRHPWLAVLALVALVALVYGPSLHHDFIWDDDGYVQNNTALRTVAGLHDLWFEIGATPQYYPLVFTSFWLEYQLWGVDPTGYHATNLLLHAIAAILLWRLLSRLALPGAWLAAALFAVHPVHVESVAWVTERKNVLSLDFALASLLVYFRAVPPEAPPGTRPAPLWRHALAGLLYLCALFSKTVTASVPAVAIVILWWKRGRIAWRDVAWLAPLFAIGLGFGALTIWMERTHVGAIGAEWNLSPVERALIAGRALWFYAAKLVWPHPLVFFYPRWEIDAGAGWQYAFPVAALLLAIALWLLRDRIGRGALAAVLIFAGVLVPALGFFDVYPFRYSFVADHFQYHASAALIAAAAAGLALARRRLGDPIAVAVAAALVCALAVTASRQVGFYRDLPTLYQSVIAANPGSWAAHNNLGRLLLNQERYEESIEQFREALALAPRQARIRNNLGSALSGLGRLDEASDELERALTSDGEATDRADGCVYLAVVRIRQSRFADAVALLRESLEIRPRDAWALYNLGVALGGGGDLGAGATAIRASIAIDPGLAIAHHELGSMLRASGDAKSALPSFEEALRIAPENATYRSSLGLALLQTGDLARAERELRASLAADPSQAEAANALGSVLGARGDLAGAEAAFEAALRADPSHALARENLRRLRDR